jgi:hypothetical protein
MMLRPISRTFIVLRAVAGLLALGALLAGFASATTPSAANQDFYLNMHKQLRPGSGSVTTKSPAALTAGTWYVAHVRGTASFVKRSMWTHPRLRHGKTAVVCGMPELSPISNAPGAETGRVGFDPEVMFAQVMRTKDCRDDPTPRTTRLFEIMPKHVWRHPTPLDGRHSIARVDHTYTYAIKGLGVRAEFREVDRPTDDNYGSFHIVLRTATAADCSQSQWKNYASENGVAAFGNVAACVAGLP